MNSLPVNNFDTCYTIHFSRYVGDEWTPCSVKNIMLATARKYYEALYTATDVELRAGNCRPYKDIRIEINRDPVCDI